MYRRIAALALGTLAAVTIATSGWGSDGPPAHATTLTPIHTASVANLTDRTYTACDATGGHCARAHVVIQEDQTNHVVLRSFVSVVCFSSAGDFACQHINGNTWLAFGTDGNDVEGPIQNCTGNCPKPLNTVSPWYQTPVQSQPYTGAFTFFVSTGAAGGGQFSLTGTTPTINF